MAKQTRAQRRARRAEQERQQGNGADARARPPQMRAAELKKVEWPGQQQLIQGTAVVLIACVIVGTYLWLADLAFKRLVQHVFLG